MKAHVSPSVKSIVVLVVAIVVFFGVETLGPNRNANPTTNQIKQHMGVGMPQTGGMMGRPGGPSGSGM